MEERTIAAEKRADAAEKRALGLDKRIAELTAALTAVMDGSVIKGFRKQLVKAEKERDDAKASGRQNRAERYGSTSQRVRKEDDANRPSGDVDDRDAGEEKSDMGGKDSVEYNKNTEPSYWLYTMKVERRDDFCKMMEANGILASQLHHRSDTHSIFKESKRELHGMEEWYANFVHIPCRWWVDAETREMIVEVIKKSW